MPDSFTKEQRNLRKRVLWPLGITLVIFLVLFLAVFQIYLQRELARKLDDHVTSVANLYGDLLTERSGTMQSLINLIQKDTALQKAMIRQNREELQRLANPLFRELLHDQQITHLYFHNPDSVNFLRAHKPDRFGDRIDRLTMKQARSGMQVAAGAEMGPLGTFTLRVVVPWFANNKLIGFIELGEEIEPLLERLAMQTGSQVAILIHKSVLDREAWKIGREMLGRSTSWDYLPNRVITATTDDQLITKIGSFVADQFLSGQNVVALSLLQQQYRGRFLSLLDAGGKEVGSMLVLLDANETLSDHRFSIGLITVFCFMLGSALFFSAYTILGRTELTLETAYTKLVNEIERTHQANIQLGLEMGEKRAAELALKEAHAELEQRVIQRTAQLNQQKQLMENLISNIPSHVAWKNLNRAYIGCNIGYAELTGATVLDIAGKSDDDLNWNIGFRRQLAEIDEAVLTENSPVIGRELNDKSADGKNRCYLCNAVPLRDEDGTVFGLVSILQNITEQKEKRQLLERTLVEARQAGDRIAGVMQSVDDALLVVDAEDNILLLNESAGALLRLNPAEVIGKKVSSAIWLGTLREQMMKVLRNREGGIEFDFEIGNSGQGATIVMQTRSSVLVDPAGRYEGMIFLARDVTKDRSMDRLKSDFISVAAHELRTPLATILGFSELLLDNNIPAGSDPQEFTRVIYDKADALSRLLDDMLDISRIESGRGLELFLETVAVKDLFMPTIMHYQKRKTEHEIITDLKDQTTVLRADPDKIAQVLENLLSNALKYSAKNSTITISGKAVVEGYHLTISDQGIGMTPEQSSHAFDKFYRGDNTDKAIKGTGIGLTIVKHIIEDHHGKVWIESRPGKGTDFHVLLPIT